MHADRSTFLERSQRSPGRPAFSPVNITPEKFGNATITGHLDLCLRKTRLGRYFYYRNVIVFEKLIFKMLSFVFNKAAVFTFLRRNVTFFVNVTFVICTLGVNAYVTTNPNKNCNSFILWISTNNREVLPLFSMSLLLDPPQFTLKSKSLANAETAISCYMSCASHSTNHTNCCYCVGYPGLGSAINRAECCGFVTGKYEPYVV